MKDDIIASKRALSNLLKQIKYLSQPTRKPLIQNMPPSPTSTNQFHSFGLRKALIHFFAAIHHIPAVSFRVGALDLTHYGTPSHPLRCCALYESSIVWFLHPLISRTIPMIVMLSSSHLLLPRFFPSMLFLSACPSPSTPASQLPDFQTTKPPDPHPLIS